MAKWSSALGLAGAVFGIALAFAACSGSTEDEPIEAGGGGQGGGAPDSALGGSAGIGGGLGGTGGEPEDVSGELLGLGDAPVCTLPTADSACGTFPQCGCDIGTQCDVTNFDTGQTACVSEGSAGANQACSAFGGKCAKGLTCTNGTCSPFCATNADCPGPNRECRQVEVLQAGQPVPVPGMTACTAGCDPVAPGLVCGAGTSCAFVEPSGPLTDCMGAGNGVGKGACGGGGGCAPGYLCVNTGSLDCLKWCRLSNPNDCASTEFCQGLQAMPAIDGVQYGVCAPK
jgi:hypothetical protein